MVAATKQQPRERPLLFSAPMVRAILAGRKTQTRRIIKPQPSFTKETISELQAAWPGASLSAIVNEAWQSGFVKVKCPHGVEGDRLWVKETFAPSYFDVGRPGYRADWSAAAADLVPEPRWRPSIFMPRAASRITLEITEVRVQRLHEISAEDAVAEGITDADTGCDGECGSDPCSLAVEAYRRLWNTIHTARERRWLEGAKERSPWVWAITFRRLAP